MLLPPKLLVDSCELALEISSPRIDLAKFLDKSAFLLNLELLVEFIREGGFLRVIIIISGFRLTTILFALSAAKNSATLLSHDISTRHPLLLGNIKLIRRNLRLRLLGNISAKLGEQQVIDVVLKALTEEVEDEEDVPLTDVDKKPLNKSWNS